MTEEKKKSNWWVNALVVVGLLALGFLAGQLTECHGKPQTNIETRWPPLDKDSIRTQVDGKDLEWERQVVVRTETIPSYSYQIDTLWGQKLWGIGAVILGPTQGSVFWRCSDTPEGMLTSSTFALPDDFDWLVHVGTEGDSVAIFTQHLSTVKRRTIISVDFGMQYNWEEDTTWAGRPAISLGVSWHPWNWLSIGPRIGFHDGFYAGAGADVVIPVVRR